MLFRLALYFSFITAIKCHDLISEVQSRIPGDCDSGFHAFVSGTSLWMHSYGAYCGFTSFRRECNIVVDSYGFYADGLSGSGNTAIDSSGIGLAVETNLAP